MHPVEASDYESYQFSDYELRLTYYRDDTYNNLGYHVEKLGAEPFNYDILYEDADVSINGIIEVNNQHLFYGSIHKDGNPTYYDGFVLMISNRGQETNSEILDYGALEEVTGVYHYDSILLFELEKSNDIDREYVFDRSIYTTYDYNLTKLNEIETTSKYIYTEVTDRLFLYSVDYNTFYEGAYTANLDHIKYDDSLAIETNQVFFDAVYIDFINDAILNGEIVSNGVYIDYPGNYQLSYNDSLYEFSVEPSIQSVRHNEIYNSKVTPVIDKGHLLLNNDVYISGTEISQPGFYKLLVRGANGYLKVVDFTITSNVEGILHNQTYVEDVSFTFEGEGFLNNVHIESPYTVDEVGEYVFKIKGENNYLETYYFNVEEEIHETNIIDFIQQWDVVFLGVTVISSYLILKKKK